MLVRRGCRARATRKQLHMATRLQGVDVSATTSSWDRSSRLRLQRLSPRETERQCLRRRRGQCHNEPVAVLRMAGSARPPPDSAEGQAQSRPMKRWAALLRQRRDREGLAEPDRPVSCCSTVVEVSSSDAEVGAKKGNPHVGCVHVGGGYRLGGIRRVDQNVRGVAAFQVGNAVSVQR